MKDRIEELTDWEQLGQILHWLDKLQKQFEYLEARVNDNTLDIENQNRRFEEFPQPNWED